MHAAQGARVCEAAASSAPAAAPARLDSTAAAAGPREPSVPPASSERAAAALNGGMHAHSSMKPASATGPLHAPAHAPQVCVGPVQAPASLSQGHQRCRYILACGRSGASMKMGPSVTTQVDSTHTPGPNEPIPAATPPSQAVPAPPAGPGEAEASLKVSFFSMLGSTSRDLKMGEAPVSTLPRCRLWCSGRVPARRYHCRCCGWGGACATPQPQTQLHLDA
jgi:hypothetical protein